MERKNVKLIYLRNELRAKNLTYPSNEKYK